MVENAVVDRCKRRALMNRYHTPSLDSGKKEQLAKLRTAHNFWYLYAKPELAGLD